MDAAGEPLPLHRDLDRHEDPLGLQVDGTERAALIRYADGCPNNTITVRRPQKAR